mmetsp:Transcript_4229/g.8564  ORF Transcript_4229/g.8564 Transcript_4229/m.8564 type:complete len:857 (+) Transcript_4229:169-2739(+)
MVLVHIFAVVLLLQTGHSFTPRYTTPNVVTRTRLHGIKEMGESLPGLMEDVKVKLPTLSDLPNLPDLSDLPPVHLPSEILDPLQNFVSKAGDVGHSLVDAVSDGKIDLPFLQSKYDVLVSALPPLNPVQQFFVGLFFTFNVISSLLSPPPLSTPYPNNSYDAKTAAQYFRTRLLTQLIRVLEISGLSASFLLSTLVLDKLFGPKGGEEEEKLGQKRGEELADLLTRLGPTFIKVGQSLSIRSDLLQPSYVLGLTKLQDAVPPFPSKDAFDIMEEQFRAPVDEVFSKITPEPIASASLGQVYKATLRETGEDVAVKIQRPRSVEKIALDMHLVRTVSGPLKSIFNLNTDLVGTVDNWGVGFVDELDYQKESENAKVFNQAIKTTTLSDVVFAPDPIDKYSTRSILTTTWIDGERLDKSSKDDVSTLCSVAMNTYLSMMLELGVLHCDPHPGNLLRTPEGKLCILDWGLVSSLDPDLQITMIEHVAHLTSGDYAEVPQDLVKLGFVPPQMVEKMKEANIVETLADIYGTWSLGGGANRIDVNSVVNDIRGLTKAGEGSIFQVPPYFFYIGKAFSVLEGIGLTNDDNYSVINACLPYISQRLIADKSERMSGALDSFVFGDQKNSDDRIINIDRFEQLASGFGEFTASGSNELTASKMQILEDQAEQVLDIILSNDTPINDLILEQLAKIIGATTRRSFMSLRERSGFALGGQRSLLGLAIDPLGIWQKSAIANVDTKDEQVIEFSRKILELAQQIGGPVFADLSDDEARQLATNLGQKLVERRAKIPAVTAKLLAFMVKQTADRLETRPEGGVKQVVSAKTTTAAASSNSDRKIANTVEKNESEDLKRARELYAASNA